jgi:hypothetical protein
MDRTYTGGVGTLNTETVKTVMVGSKCDLIYGTELSEADCTGPLIKRDAINLGGIGGATNGVGCAIGCPKSCIF